MMDRMTVGRPKDYVQETRFGFWFLGTFTWQHEVVRVALDDLQRLMPPGGSYRTILDAGCGQGKTFGALAERFKPKRLIGVDLDAEGLERARAEAAHYGVAAELIETDCAATGLPDACVDLVLCHQTLHHLARQEETLAEFLRVLKPGGVLLLAESTKAYIESWVIRLLFRHPMHVQRTAEGYLDLLRGAGFEFGPENVSYPYLWWSRAKDFGILEALRLYKPKPGERVETLVNIAARKPV